jgi:hypothetical protein
MRSPFSLKYAVLINSLLEPGVLNVEIVIVVVGGGIIAHFFKFKYLLKTCLHFLTLDFLCFFKEESLKISKE